METFRSSAERRNNKTIPFEDWVFINLNVLNEIIYKITNSLTNVLTNSLTNDSGKCKFVIDGVGLSEDILLYLYNTSNSKFNNEINFIKE